MGRSSSADILVAKAAVEWASLPQTKDPIEAADQRQNCEMGAGERAGAENSQGRNVFAGEIFCGLRPKWRRCAER